MKTKVHGLNCSPLDLVSALAVIARKWKVQIIWHLLGGKKRFNELYRLLAEISRSTLTFELRQLQRHRIIDRTQYSTIPPTVEYKLTASSQPKGSLLAQYSSPWINGASSGTQTKKVLHKSHKPCAVHWMLLISKVSRTLITDESRTCPGSRSGSTLFQSGWAAPSGSPFSLRPPTRLARRLSYRTETANAAIRPP
jgi:DNA-binding HxlR family transcriptional regulator